MPAKAQAGQENFRLKIRTGINFVQNPPSKIFIQYRFGDSGPITDWAAQVLSGEGANGVIYKDFSVESPVPAAGAYRVRAKLTIDGRVVYTEPADWIVGAF